MVYKQAHWEEFDNNRERSDQGHNKNLKILKLKEEIRNCKLKSDRQYNMQKNKRKNNDLHNITQKTKDRATRTLLKSGW